MNSIIFWYARQDSNLRPLTPEASALSAELRARRIHYKAPKVIRDHFGDISQTSGLMTAIRSDLDLDNNRTSVLFYCQVALRVGERAWAAAKRTRAGYPSSKPGAQNPGTPLNHRQKPLSPAREKGQG